VFTILARTLRLVAARWPQLLAWYLAGWVGRYALIELAALAGTLNPLAGYLVLPLAILARLGSFIAMFLVLRPAMPGYQSVMASGEGDIDTTGTTAVDPTAGDTTVAPKRTRATDMLLVSILPFFAFYAAWKLLADDTLYYMSTVLARTNFFDEDRTGGLELTLEPVTITAIVIAFAARYLLKKLADRLPKWTRVVAVYFEAVWIYLSLVLIVNYQEQLQGWIASRAATHWFADVKEAAFSIFAPLGWAWSGVEWVLSQAGSVALLPLAWLTLAGIVYGRALAAPTVAFRVKNRYLTTVKARARFVPQALRRRASDVGSTFTGRWKPLANAILLIWRAGVVPMGLFILVYTVLEVASTWLFFAAIRIIGPQDFTAFWTNSDNLISFFISTLLEPLRLCLVVAAYDFCLQQLEKRRAAEPIAGPPAEPAETPVPEPRA